MSNARTTRTLNPLPFQSLEPHRFEDLVRQLAYDFRIWRSIEAVGRSGDDEGIDILAWERTGPQPLERETDDEEEAAEPQIEPDRLWVIQCKRENSIGPSKAGAIIDGFFAQNKEAPYGYVLAAAADFSLKTRRATADILRSRGVQEVHFWAKGELEDMLFQPKNDHILFAYFGISLQVRRRSMRTELRSRLTLKRKLAKELGDVQGTHFKPVLIRDPLDERYPYIESPEEFVKNAPWRYWEFQVHEPPDHLSFLTGKFFAYVDWETEEWDVYDDDTANMTAVHHPQLFGLDHNSFDPSNTVYLARAYWELKVPAENRGYAMRKHLLEYERILAVDELGDHFNEGPHLLVEYVDAQPFSRRLKWLESANDDDPYREKKVLWCPKDEKRIAIFPRPLPDLTKEYQTFVQKRAAEREEERKKGSQRP